VTARRLLSLACAIDFDSGKVIYDPLSPITDYRFCKLSVILPFNCNPWFSGMTTAALDPVMTTLANLRTSSHTDKASDPVGPFPRSDYLPCGLRTRVASTLRCSSITRAPDLSSRGWHGSRANCSAAPYRIAGLDGHDPEEHALARSTQSHD
jgi:hypothetical protein